MVKAPRKVLLSALVTRSTVEATPAPTLALRRKVVMAFATSRMLVVAVTLKVVVTVVPAFTADERAALSANSAALHSIQPESWDLIRRYLRATLRPGDPGWQPRSRLQFLKSPGDVLSHATRWQDRQPKPPLPRAPTPLPQNPPLDRATIALALNLKIPHDHG